ncbi:sigma-70 family RNA polymerase sigma factor [Sphingobium subterraneum]|uniref:RNA polymerase sigma factor n=1 Tax=Sphingobium subterraneum TaxID=627688 RepID=A0A841J8P4_9SPHN|nr:sigma-70 family RNA polymerase sigma factor [Sphingobium subterraneum]MBB6124918.1 RNA polymerase sigma-70 factor (ECF subfamily) [Sphingobium subterraneum]
MAQKDIEVVGRDRERLVSALQLAAVGDASSLRIVYKLTSAKLFGICLRICGNRQAAEDILQDVYVKVWRRAGSFDSQRASPISWLAMIAHNAAVDWRRAQHHHGTLDDDAVLSIADEAPLADAVAEQDEDRRRLLSCLDGLDESQSSVIRRAFLDGMTYQQLSDESGTPLGTIKSWIRRGLQKLKECLNDG